jgi:glycosyltransferase involved in cell wall biosynthesis
VEIWRPLTGRPLPDKAVGPHLILVGMDFVPRRVSGDKNFWYELIHALSGAISRITIISLDPSPEIRHKMVDYFCVAEMPICLRRLPTRLLRWGTSLSNRGGTFPHGLAVVEKMVSCVSLWQEIRAVQRPLEPTQVHLMDNLGPINPLLATVLNIPVSVSAIAFNGRRPPGIQKLYALLSFLHPKIRAIPYTRAYQERLRSWGIKAVHHIPWGVDTRLPLPSAEAKTQAKALLQLDPALPLYVWSGFIQQIDEADFHLAVRQARAAMDKGLRATFFFAFKSACYNNNYGAWHAPERGIIVKGTSVAEFEQLRLAADVFYSPFSQQSHIIGPPLTWIEFMAQGVPIVTTAVGGVEEIISQGRTGFIAPEPNLLPEMLLAVRDCSREMRNDCQDEMRHQRDLRLIAQKYLKLWFGDKQ